MAFAAVTILMDTLHQHFLQPTPRFPLRNKTKVRLLYKNLSSLQTSLEQDFKVGECDEAIKALEAQMRDVSIELRFQIEHHLTLFYLGKSMKLRLHSAQKLLPILNRATKGGIETMDLKSGLEMLWKHFMLPVSRMPPHINKRVKSFFTQYGYHVYKGLREDEQESEDEKESGDEQESEDEKESGDEQESEDEKESRDEQESEDEQESGNEQESDDEQESRDELETKGKTEYELKNKKKLKGDDEQRSKDEQEESDGEWETEEEQNSDDEQGSQDEQEESDDYEWLTDEDEQHILCEAESIIRQELRAPSYLNKYMKQRTQARHKIHQIFMQGIKLTYYIKKEVLKVKNAHYNQSNTPQGNNTCASLRLRGPEGENITVGDSLQHTTIEMVGCDDEFNMIMDKLNQQSKQREIVSIVGMGGIGKTTLAKRIYGDASFISRFDCRAWVTISQDYNPIKVLNALLHSLAPGVHEENNEASNNELAEVVYKCLKRQRYLIIIDDIWNTDVWCDLQKCFPDDNNQSRMLLTTRLKNVADYASSGGNLCHTMRFLDSYESWNLFHNQVLSQRITLSPELERIGREIVKKCKGLPLAINVVAGLLSNPKQDLNEWELIAKNVRTLSIDHSNKLIDLSYIFLPHHLKHCFLSIGLFPEDEELPEYYIVDFWVSEGFLKVLRSKSLEDVARESLQDLVDRNLLLVSTKMNVNGSLKVYQMHDVLRELALKEAQKENLLCLKNNSFIFSAGFRRTQLINSSCISHPWSIQSKICSYNSLSHTCSTFLNLDLSTHRYSKQFHFHSKFLRRLILDVPDDDAYAFTELMGLVHLRCLKSSTTLKLNSLPLFMLWNLQKLDVEDYFSTNEPLNIWGLPQLKNLTVGGGVRLVPPRSVHHNLESIRCLDHRSCTEELFMRIPNLRTLEVELNLKRKAFNWLESLACLYKLEDLQVWGKLFNPKFSTIHSMGTLSIEIFLPNLKKLKLIETKLNWENMYVVGMLPKLEVLILKDNAAVGRKCKPKDGGFRGLKFLTIDQCDGLQIWKATGGHFPILECLILMHMSSFKKIPSDFADITTLKSIKLYNCLKSAISSAKCIQEEQREYGNDAFTVDILRVDDLDASYWYY